MKATITTTGHIPAPALHNASSSGGGKGIHNACESGLVSIVNEGNYISILDIVASDLLELSITPTFHILPFNNNLHTLCHCWVPYILDSSTSLPSSLSSISTTSSTPLLSNISSTLSPGQEYGKPANFLSVQNILIIGHERQILLYNSPYTKPIGEINVYFEIKTLAAISIRYNDLCSMLGLSTTSLSTTTIGNTTSSHKPSLYTPNTNTGNDESMKTEGKEDELLSTKDLILIAIGGVNGVQLHIWSPYLTNSSVASIMIPSTLPWPILEMLPGYLISHIAFSPSGKLLSIIAYDGHVGIWEVPLLLSESNRIRELRIIDLRKKLRTNAKLHIQHTHSILKSQGFATAFQNGKQGKHGKGKTGFGKHGKGLVNNNNNTNSITTTNNSITSLLNDAISTTVPAVAHGVIRDGRITAVTISENDQLLALALHDGRVVIYGRCDQRTDIQWLHLVEGAPDALIGNNYNFTTTVTPMTTSPNSQPNTSPPQLINSVSNTTTAQETTSTISSFSSRIRNLNTNSSQKASSLLSNNINSSSSSSLLPRRWGTLSNTNNSAHISTEKNDQSNPPVPSNNSISVPPPPPPPGPIYQPQWWPPILAIDHTGAIAPMLAVCDRPRTNPNQTTEPNDSFAPDISNYILPGIENCTDTMINNNRTASKLHGPTLLSFIPENRTKDRLMYNSNRRSTSMLIIGNSRSQKVFTVNIHHYNDPQQSGSSSSSSMSDSNINTNVHSPHSNQKSRSNSEQYSPSGSHNFTFTPGRQSNGLLSLHHTGLQRSSSMSSTSSTHSSSMVKSSFPLNNNVITSTLNYLSQQESSDTLHSGISLTMPPPIVSATPNINMMSPSTIMKPRYTANSFTTNTLTSANSLSSIKRLRMDEDDDILVTDNTTAHSSPSSVHSLNNEDLAYRMRTGTAHKIPALLDPDHDSPFGRSPSLPVNLPLYTATPLGVLTVGNNIAGLNVVSGRPPQVSRSRSIPSIIRIVVLDSLGTMYIIAPFSSSSTTSTTNSGLMKHSPSSPLTNVQLSFASPVAHNHSNQYMNNNNPNTNTNDELSIDSSNWPIISCQKNTHVTITEALATLITAQHQQMEQALKYVSTIGSNNTGSLGISSSSMKR